ncbi:TonB-dependent receptor [Sphingomonas gei]|uniref:TonB-dependent receptor n=1 Tax=Sphingomonas gei TaxID=1395960 RepID=A0A4V3QY28_9SPHN|nr:TonB-dependent receptor [Sphingomonas gei]TGX48742.1 TonB-dependent receptor [Sphingomonas gei]
MTRVSPRGALLLSAAAIALVSGQACAQSAAAPANAQDRDDKEIVVTATKRPEAVRDISGSVTAHTGEQLEKLGADSMADYLTRTPGVVFNPSTPGGGNVTIRGVSTTTGQESGQATTGIFINDVPLTDPAFSIGTPDIDTFDVDNVAVLRGPQGTLFGSSSLGGAVNYQAAKPDLDRIGARGQATLRDTRQGATGGAGKVMLNAPIVEGKLGVRGVFVYRRDAGYFDNLGTGRSDVGRTRTYSGRILATWRAGESTTFNYLYLEQRQDTDDVGYQLPGLGELRKSSSLPEPASYSTLIHQLRLDQDLSFATLTATATRHKKSFSYTSDMTEALSPALFGLAPVSNFGAGTSKGETFEIRLASAPGGSFEYLFGAMYDRTAMKQGQNIYAAGLADLLDVAGPGLGLPAGAGQQLAPGDLLVNAQFPATARELALFGEGSYRLGDQWKVTLGGRLFEQRLTNASDAYGTFVLLTQGSYTQTTSDTRRFSGFSPKASLTWTPGEDLMVYALASKGYRFGGSNLITFPGVPASYDSDSLWNYEIGTRADFLDRKLLLDLTGFYIDWSNIQLKRKAAGIDYADNAGDARIFGVEASVTLRPTRWLNLSTNLTYLDAKLSKTFDPDPSDPSDTIFPKGTRLPGAAKWQVSNTLSYDLADAALAPSFVLAHRYVSRSPSQLEGTTSQGGYSLFDARAGVNFGPFGATVFIENIGDKRGIATSAVVPPIQQYIVRPRTIGITLDVKL